MGSKMAILMLGLLAILLFITSGMAARDLKEDDFVKETNQVGGGRGRRRFRPGIGGPFLPGSGGWGGGPFSPGIGGWGGGPFSPGIGGYPFPGYGFPFGGYGVGTFPPLIPGVGRGGFP